MGSVYANNGNVVAAGSIGNNTTNNFRFSLVKYNDISFDIKRPEYPLIGRYYELERLNEKLQQPPNITVVAGLGGIGKTQLIRRFIEEYRSSYKNVIWIDSKNIESIHTSFKNLAKNNLGIAVAQKGFESIVDLVFGKISESKTLFIYDNVVEIKNIKLLVYRASSGQNPHTIITSRLQQWGDGIDVIQLKAWEIHDAMKYVKTTLNGGNDSKGDIELLVKTLQAFPLALRQATAYIKDKRIDQSFQISDYIRKYDTKQMLDSKLFQNYTNCLYTETIFTTWNSTFDAVKRDKNNGLLAVTILNIIAYFAPSNIKREIFSNFKCHKNQFLEMIFNMVETLKLFRREKIDYEENIRFAVRLLINHSLVDITKEKSQFSVHKLVQRVTQVKLQEANCEKKYLRYAITLIGKFIKHENFYDWHKHVVSVFACLLKFRDLVNEFLVYNKQSEKTSTGNHALVNKIQISIKNGSKQLKL